MTSITHDFAEPFTREYARQHILNGLARLQRELPDADPSFVAGVKAAADLLTTMPAMEQAQ
jgi:hypothetical protein